MSVKLGGAATVKLMVAVLCKLPEVPVMVTVAVPKEAEPLAVRVSVPGVVVVAALNNAVTPVGKPDAASATAPLKPFSGAMVMVLAPMAP